MATVSRKWDVSPVAKKHPSQKPTFSGYLRVLPSRHKHGFYYYVQLRWGRNGTKTKLLGSFPFSSPTPLMDVVLYAAYQPGRLELEELYRLLHADKSIQIV